MFKRKVFFLLLPLLLFSPNCFPLAAASSPSIFPEDLDNLGNYYWQKGDIHRAISFWQKEQETYREQGESELEIQASFKISQGYISLGQFELAIFELKNILSMALEPSLIAYTWQQLGNAYSRSEKLEKAVEAYNKSLSIEKTLPTLNNLVIVLRKQSQMALLQAMSARPGLETKKYQQLASSYQTQAKLTASEALLLSHNDFTSSSLRALISWGELSPSLSFPSIVRGRSILKQLPGSRHKIFLTINWAKLDKQRTNYWLDYAKYTAESIRDAFAHSYVFLELGKIAEEKGEYRQALQYAQAAIIKAQFDKAYGSLYQAQWLTGRIYNRMSYTSAAISSYSQAITALDAFNQGLINIDIQRRLDFETKIEPIYREMLTLLLEKRPTQSNLQQALFVFERLRIAQLQNYFGDNCFDIERKTVAVKDFLTNKNAVLLHSILLENQTHFIVQLPNGQLLHSQVDFGKGEINDLVKNWYEKLQRNSYWRFAEGGKLLYTLILRPFEAQLEQINPSMIIFIHDGLLRNIPMAALFDGEQFLVQKWASVNSLGFIKRKTLENDQPSQAVAFGLEVKREGWSELVEVDREVKAVIDILGGSEFLNFDFTYSNFFTALERGYPFVHLATHGYFGGVAENSFLLAYDQRISALDLKDSLSQSQTAINLLVLSACETAIGSDRSVLGLAGVALRSGVTFVLGNFWQVFDYEQPELIEAFYSRLKEQPLAENLELATVLRAVQIEQIEQLEPPSKWAALSLFESY